MRCPPSLGARWGRPGPPTPQATIRGPPGQEAGKRRRGRPELPAGSLRFSFEVPQARKSTGSSGDAPDPPRFPFGAATARKPGSGGRGPRPPQAPIRGPSRRAVGKRRQGRPRTPPRMAFGVPPTRKSGGGGGVLRTPQTPLQGPPGREAGKRRQRRQHPPDPGHPSRAPGEKPRRVRVPSPPPAGVTLTGRPRGAASEAGWRGAAGRARGGDAGPRRSSSPDLVGARVVHGGGGGARRSRVSSLAPASGRSPALSPSPQPRPGSAQRRRRRRRRLPPPLGANGHRASPRRRAAAPAHARARSRTGPPGAGPGVLRLCVRPGGRFRAAAVGAVARFPSSSEAPGVAAGHSGKWSPCAGPAPEREGCARAEPRACVRARERLAIRAKRRRGCRFLFNSPLGSCGAVWGAGGSGSVPARTPVGRTERERHVAVPCEAPSHVPISQKRIPRVREAESLGQGHSVRDWTGIKSKQLTKFHYYERVLLTPPSTIPINSQILF